MRWIIGIAAALVCLGWLACQIELADADVRPPRQEDGWRRTVGGWERLVTLQPSAAQAGNLPIWRSHPHPLVATLLLIMLSVTLLVASTEGTVFDFNQVSRTAVTPGSPSI